VAVGARLKIFRSSEHAAATQRLPAELETGFHEVLLRFRFALDTAALPSRFSPG